LQISKWWKPIHTNYFSLRVQDNPLNNVPQKFFLIWMR